MLKPMPIALVSLVALGAVPGTVAVLQGTAGTRVDAAAQAATAAAAPRQFLDTYCVTCHNERLRTAQLVLDKTDLAKVGEHAEVWEKAVAAPAWDGPPTWLHGDLHPANVVTRDGTLAGVIDFGDMCAGLC